MKTRRSILQAAAKLLAASTGVSLAASAAPPVKWVAFYGWAAPEKLLASYDLVVLDPMFRGSVSSVAEEGARVCSYLSLGEVRTSDAVFGKMDPGALMEENANWPGTRRIDVRHKQWASLVIEELIPAIASKGFTGLLLDTLDTPAYLETVDPNANDGMRQASIDLVQSIRREHPTMMLIVNRGYAILPDVVDSVDAILAESLLTSPDQSLPDGHKWNDAAEVKLQSSLLVPALRPRRPLPILSLDYWNPRDSNTIREIYLAHRQLGHHPYVATRLLDEIVPEPTI